MKFILLFLLLLLSGCASVYKETRYYDAKTEKCDCSKYDCVDYQAIR